MGEQDRIKLWAPSLGLNETADSGYREFRSDNYNTNVSAWPRLSVTYNRAPVLTSEVGQSFWPGTATHVSSTAPELMVKVDDADEDSSSVSFSASKRDGSTWTSEVSATAPGDWASATPPEGLLQAGDEVLFEAKATDSGGQVAQLSSTWLRVDPYAVVSPARSCDELCLTTQQSVLTSRNMIAGESVAAPLPSDSSGRPFGWALVRATTRAASGATISVSVSDSGRTYPQAPAVKVAANGSSQVNTFEVYTSPGANVTVRNTASVPTEIALELIGWREESDDSTRLANGAGFTDSEVENLDAATDVEQVVATALLPGPVDAPADQTEVQVGVSGSNGDVPPNLESEIAATLKDMSGTSDAPVAGEPVAPTWTDAQIADAAAAAELDEVAVSDEENIPDAYDQFVEVPSDSAVTQQPNCSGAWWPAKLVAKTGASSYAGQRFAQLEFYWSAARLSSLKCHGNVTFEPDFITYNYDDAAYYRWIGTWATSMPNGYKDTTFMDGNNEKVYTIGTTDAQDLKSAKTYKTYFRSRNGNASSDTVKINLQRGSRTPSGCHNTWCIFSKATKRVPNSGWFAIPGTRTFYP